MNETCYWKTLQLFLRSKTSVYCHYRNYKIENFIEFYTSLERFQSSIIVNINPKHLIPTISEHSPIPRISRKCPIRLNHHSSLYPCHPDHWWAHKSVELHFYYNEKPISTRCSKKLRPREAAIVDSFGSVNRICTWWHTVPYFRVLKYRLCSWHMSLPRLGGSALFFIKLIIQQPSICAGNQYWVKYAGWICGKWGLVFQYSGHTHPSMTFYNGLLILVSLFSMTCPRHHSKNIIFTHTFSPVFRIK